MANPQKENGYTSISNEIMEILAKTYIPSQARQLLDVIIRKTYGYNKKIDQIPTKQFMQATGLNKLAISRARKYLLVSKMITVIKSDTSQILSYSFQKDYEKWKQVSKMIPVSNKIQTGIKSDTQLVSNECMTIYTKDNKQKKTKESTDFISELRAIYTGLDLDSEVNKMRGWLLNYPNRKLTKRFAIGWLNRALDSQKEIIPKGNPYNGLPNQNF